MDRGAAEVKHEFVSVRNSLFQDLRLPKGLKFVCHFTDH
jgi:hypothetical protein